MYVLHGGLQKVLVSQKDLPPHLGRVCMMFPCTSGCSLSTPLSLQKNLLARLTGESNVRVQMKISLSMAAHNWQATSWGSTPPLAQCVGSLWYYNWIYKMILAKKCVF